MQIGATMRKLDQYLSTIDTIYPDGHARESYFRDSGDMLAPRALEFVHNGTLLSRLWAALRTWHVKRVGRTVLRELSDDMLRDIGVTREEALREADRSRVLLFRELR